VSGLTWLHLDPAHPVAVMRDEFDLTTAAELVADLGERVRDGALEIVLDFTDVTNCVSSALSLFARVAQGEGVDVTVRSPSDHVVTLIDLAGLDRLLSDDA
jgi:anti-anti-sigma factor